MMEAKTLQKNNKKGRGFSKKNIKDLDDLILELQKPEDDDKKKDKKKDDKKKDTPKKKNDGTGTKKTTPARKESDGTGTKKTTPARKESDRTGTKETTPARKESDGGKKRKTARPPRKVERRPIPVRSTRRTRSSDFRTPLFTKEDVPALQIITALGGTLFATSGFAIKFSGGVFAGSVFLTSIAPLLIPVGLGLLVGAFIWISLDN